MIRIENIDVCGWEPAIRGMRNPMNSWNRMDSYFTEHGTSVGENDLDLMKRLFKGGTEHRKYLRFINITMDITCHHAWWAEFDTYKVGTVRNSCSKMHKIHVKEFVKDDFSHEGIDEVSVDYPEMMEDFERVMKRLEWLRVKFNETHEKRYWRAIIELLPMGYNIKATVQMSYEVAVRIIEQRKGHKLDEWHELVNVLLELPYMKQITGMGE